MQVQRISGLNAASDKEGLAGKKESDNRERTHQFTTEGEEFAHTTMFAGATLACNGSP